MVKLTNFSLQPGQYYLVKLTSGGAVGSALPTEDASGAINMSGTNGKVALSNDTLAITSCPPNAAIVDFVGYGSANCFEGAAAAPTSGGNTSSVMRASNGCQDGNNNAADFTGTAANPRNSSSPFSTCGAATPVLFAQPGALNITSTVGSPSAVSSYTLTGSTLSPASGNILVGSGAGLQISLSSGGPFNTSLALPYSGGVLAATVIYVRIVSGALQGVFSDVVTNSGGGANTVNVPVNGGVYQNYYNTKANLGLNVLGTWSTATNGSGASPASFNDPYQFFNIINQTNANYTGVWDASSTGNTSRIVVGDGVNPISFTVLPDADSVTFATRVDILNNGTLVIQNNRKPFINLMDIGSTVDFAEPGTTSADTVRIPALSYYNLKLTDGLKYLSTGTTAVRGNFIMDGVIRFNGATTSVSKLNVFGDINCINPSVFDASDAGRVTIAFNGNSGAQAFNGNGTEFALFRVQRDSTTTTDVITLGASTTLTLGTGAGGGLQMNQGGGNTTTLDIANNTVNLNAGSFVTSSASGSLNSNGGIININKNAGTGNAGNLRFVSGASLNTLNINFDAAFAKDTVNLYDTVIVQNLLLNKGKIVVNPNTDGLIDIPNGGVVTGGSVTAYVDGKIKRTTAGTTTYPVGSANKYAPVTVAVTAGGTNSYTVSYFFKPYGSYSIDPVTLSNFPTYNISKFEYWTVDQATSPATANLTFSWQDAGSQVNNPALLRVAHYDGADWDDVGGTVAPGSTTSNGSITANGVAVFSPFTLSSTQLNVIPVKLEYMRGQKNGSRNLLNWKLTCTSASLTMEIERAADTRNFSSIGSINATQARCSQPFDFTDAQPLAGYNYYRLKMTDIDGKVSYSPVVLISSNQKGFAAAGIYPSVVSSQASLSISSSEATSIKTRITDMAGRVLQRSSDAIAAGSSLLNVDCSKLAAGYYNITVTNAAGNSSTLRFIKQ
ncbi:MAG: T9SS type A sorting domain-containing protein [Chitinophagaceae bacterium]|nr:T9SS type A sorting domain-containing protein [Chitinophagaceae bacterium]